MVGKLRTFDICIVGGCGHVGLPLGMAFADQGMDVVLYDINQGSIDQVNSGCMPFLETGAPETLNRVLLAGKLRATADTSVIARSENIVMVVGTPVDEYLNPRLHDIFRAVAEVEPYLDTEQLLVMRSTLFPGATQMVYERLMARGLAMDVAFCPERIAEGRALEELRTLPQIVSGCTPAAAKRAGELFKVLAPKVIEISPTEAELAKLIANNTRYLLFAMANQFYEIAEKHGLNYARIHEAVTEDYPRLQMLPTPGLAAGPCLRKDAAQLLAFAGREYLLGQAAMSVNEGLPDFIVERLALSVDLAAKTVGVLGMAFKANSDDPRESLSYKLRKKLELVAGEVLCTDVYIRDPRFVPLDEVLERADILVLAAPHREYRLLNFNGKPVVDIWNFYGQGGAIS